MGQRGPAPKREAERTRTNKQTESGESTEVTKGTATPVTWPSAPREWDPMARDLYNGLRKSGMAAYYQQSDVALARIICNEISLYLQTSEYKRSSMMLASLMTALNGLGVTEGERRRMRIELEAPKAPKKSASVTAIESYKKQLGVAE